MANENSQTAGATGSTDTSTTSVVEPRTEPGQPTISDIMGFDPFSPGPDGQMVVKETKPEVKPGETQPEIKPEVKPEVKPEPKLDAQGKPIPEPQVTKPAVTAPASLDTKPMEQLIREQTAIIQRSLERPEPAKKDEPAAPRFNLGVPEQLVNAMASDDPRERATALNSVISGVANHVWNAVQEHVQQQLVRVVENIPNVIAAHSSYSKQQEQVSSDFFGKYEMFKGEAFGPILQDAAIKVAQAWQGAGKPIGWNDEFRDAVAENMFTRFPMLKPQQQQQQQPQGETGKRPPFATGGGSRQPAAAANEFEAVLAST